MKAIVGTVNRCQYDPMGPELASRSRKIMLAKVGKICSTLTPNLSKERKAFYAMNKLPKYKPHCWPKYCNNRPAGVLQIS